MSRTVKTIKSAPLATVTDEYSESDEDIQLTTNKMQSVVIEHAPKPKRTLNLSDAERERRRQSMIKTREARQQKIEEKRRLEEEYIRQKEDEVQDKILKKAMQLKKKKEKELYNQILQEEINVNKVSKPTASSLAGMQPKQSKKKQPKVVYVAESESESESDTESDEEDIVYVKKKRPVKPKKEVREHPTEQIQQPIQQQPIQQYHRPFRVC